MTEATTTANVELAEETQAPLEKPTATTAKEAGMTSREIEMATKQGLIEEKPAEEKPKQDAGAIEAQEKTELAEAAKKDLSKDEEKRILGKLDKISQAYYWEKKKERVKRQQAEADRSYHEARSNVFAKEVEALKAELEKHERNKQSEDQDLNQILEENNSEPAKSTEPVEPKELQEAKSRQLTAKLNQLDIEARQAYEDYDSTIELTADLLQNVNDIYKDQPKMVAKIKRMARQWYEEAANALDSQSDYTAADIAYELGKLHPKYGSKPEAEAKPEQDTEKLPEDKMQKILKNSEKDASSATLNGGKRYVSAENITLEQASRLSQQEYAKLPTSVRERLLKATSKT